MLGDGKIGHTAECVPVLVRIRGCPSAASWRCLAVLLMGLGAAAGFPWQELPPSSNTQQRAKQRSGAEQGPAPTEAGGCAPPRSRSCTNQSSNSLPGRSYSDVKTNPSARTGAGLAAQRDEWNETQLWIMCLLMNLSPKVHTLIYAALKKSWFLSLSCSFQCINVLYVSLDKCHICTWLTCWFAFPASTEHAWLDMGTGLDQLHFPGL